MHLLGILAARQGGPYASRGKHFPAGGCLVGARRRRLAARRKALGYTQESFAEQLGVDRTTVGRLERGETDPYPHLRRELRRALRITASELDTLLSLDPGNDERPPGTRQAALAAAQGAVPGTDWTGALDDMHRRELFRLLSLAGVVVVMPAADAAGDPSAFRVPEPGNVGQYAQLNRHLWELFVMSRAKRLVYPLVHDQLRVVIDQLGRSHPASVHRQLCILLCDLFQLAGEIFFDGDRYTDAAHCYSLAASAGRESLSYDRWACALTRQAFVNMYDKQYLDAASVLSAATRVARNGDSQLSTRHWIAAVQAQAYAQLGDRRACHQALDAADQVLGMTGQVSPGGWLRFDGSRLSEEHGTCYLTLGQSELAEAKLTEGLSRTVSLRRRGSLLTDLALVGVQQQDRDQLLLYGGEAADVAEQTESSGYVGRKLRILQAQIEPQLADTKVAQLHDRITQLLHAC